jgi:hypothetical protein
VCCDSCVTGLISSVIVQVAVSTTAPNALESVRSEASVRADEQNAKIAEIASQPAQMSSSTPPRRCFRASILWSWFRRKPKHKHSDGYKKAKSTDFNVGVHFGFYTMFLFKRPCSLSE